MTRSTALRIARPCSSCRLLSPLGAPALEPYRSVAPVSPSPRDREPEKGFEPLAPALQERCSDQLSYSGDAHIVVVRALLRLSRHRQSAQHPMPRRLQGATLEVSERKSP